MMLRILVAATLLAGPAFAAGEEGGYDSPHGLFSPSLGNTDFVVLIGFLTFLAVLFYFNVPATIGAMLDKRAQTIRAELDEARALREEAQTLLASYERKSREVAEQSERIIAQARTDAEAAAEAAKAELQRSIARRLAAAEDQIASAEAKAIRAVKDQAVDVAIAAAADVIAGRTGATEANKMIDDAISEVERKLH